MANPAVEQANARITRATTVLAGLKIYAESVPGWIRAAVEKAMANGATAAELEPLTTLAAELEANADATEAAARANTPEASA